jgi:hypothetical protein
MAKVEVYRCDECGAEKKETNHWFLIALRRGIVCQSVGRPQWPTQLLRRSTSAANSAPTKSYRSGWRE